MTPTNTPAAAKELAAKLREDRDRLYNSFVKYDAPIPVGPLSELEEIAITLEASPSSGLAEAVAKIEALPTFSGQNERGIWISRKETLAILKEQTGGSDP
jgi:hypothetical protein